MHIARAHGCFQRHGCRRAKAFPAHRVELCVVRIRAVWPASYGAATAGRTRKSDVAHSLRHTLQHEDARCGGSQVRPGHAVRATSTQAHDNEADRRLWSIKPNSRQSVGRSERQAARTKTSCPQWHRLPCIQAGSAGVWAWCACMHACMSCVCELFCLLLREVACVHA